MAAFPRLVWLRWVHLGDAPQRILLIHQRLLGH